MLTTARIMALGAILSLSATAALANGPSRHRGADTGYVTAESRFGHGTVQGPVRLARAGNYEVRLPGGTWISCGRNCAETLRIESIDFWENKGAGQGNRIDNECGLFGCLSRGYGF
jgi:hypothetical protein